MATIEELEQRIQTLIEDLNRKIKEIDHLKSILHDIKYLSPGIQLNIELTSGFEKGQYGFRYQVSKEAIEQFKYNPETIIRQVTEESIKRIIEYHDNEGNHL